MDNMECLAYWNLKLEKDRDVDFDYKRKLKTQIDVAEFGMEAFNLEEQPEEICGVIAMNGNLKPVAIFKVSHGSLEEVIAHPRAIFKRVLLCNAKAFAVIHNHPAGDCTLSEEDMLLFLTLREAAKQLGLELHDMIATGEDGAFQTAREQEEKLEDALCEMAEEGLDDLDTGEEMTVEAGRAE